MRADPEFHDVHQGDYQTKYVQYLLCEQYPLLGMDGQSPVQCIAVVCPRTPA